MEVRPLPRRIHPAAAIALAALISAPTLASPILEPGPLLASRLAALQLLIYLGFIVFLYRRLYRRWQRTEVELQEVRASRDRLARILLKEPGRTGVGA